MQDKSIQRLRYRLKSIGCHSIKLFVRSDYVLGSFYYFNEYYRVRIPICDVDSYPPVRYILNV